MDGGLRTALELHLRVKAKVLRRANAEHLRRLQRQSRNFEIWRASADFGWRTSLDVYHGFSTVLDLEVSSSSSSAGCRTLSQRCHSNPLPLQKQYDDDWYTQYTGCLVRYREAGHGRLHRTPPSSSSRCSTWSSLSGIWRECANII